MAQTPTTDQLRNRIDRGATGEKVDFPDPAAAPLGTDAEAGGAPPTTSERATEAAEQTVRELRVPPNGVVLYLGIILVVVIAIVVVTNVGVGAR